MILQALVQHYEDLAVKGEIAQPGWGSDKISYALHLDDCGNVLRIISIKTEHTSGKKTVLIPRTMIVPEPADRHGKGYLPNFLYDNAKYLFGISQRKDENKKTVSCIDYGAFSSSHDLHKSLLSEVSHPAAVAILRFYESWDIDNALVSSVLEPIAKDLQSGARIVFYYDGKFCHEIPELTAPWTSHYSDSFDGPSSVCLVTGQISSIARIHPPINGVKDAKANAKLVSINTDALSGCSYGKEQGLNSPTSEYAAFAYGAALNHLLADRKHVFYIGDTAVLCWAHGGDSAYQDAFDEFLCEDTYTENDFRQMAKAVSEGRPFEFRENLLDPDCPFYVLGIAPNAARLSVRFFLRNTLGHFLKNITAHQERLRIERPSYDKNEVLSIWRLLNETVNQNARDKAAAPNLAGELLRAVLENSRYPATLLNSVQLRIRADRNITRGRAAIIKAYYLKNRHPDVPEEVLTMSLNPTSSNIPYQLGRLFSHLENIQSSANPGLNATIKDRYFNAASATPAYVFPVLLNLAQNHLKVIGRDRAGLKITLEKQLQEILAQMDETYPVRLTLPQQGSFQLGYYHQTQERYRKKEEK